MHELSIASALVDNVVKFANSPPSKKVLKVLLQIGEFTCVEPEQLLFCYSVATRETSIEDSVLEIEQVAAEVRCLHCGYAGPPKYWDDALAAKPVATLECPTCGNATEVTHGHDCTIRTIRYIEQ
ncbi:MAG: hydrogenase maturation nickel metallochaperone HypA [Methylacidiphilales bacterium]|nr:hydrogenase maturation nickel metallochaperone HypA [Candidatus Methylacidiphilales bacterium]